EFRYGEMAEVVCDDQLTSACGGVLSDSRHDRRQYVPPVLSAPLQSLNATTDYQESVTLTCITSGSPQPILTWHRKGQHLEPSERYLLHNADGGRSTLTIRNIGQADGGAYTCKATNKAGSQEKELFLKVF
ncbi:hypothetical protein NHX12_015145, partial [Muraenolepis orangiensis]